MAELVRERITHVAPDDDLNYTVLAMLVLEGYGDAFSQEELAWLWHTNLPIASAFGPERARLISDGWSSMGPFVGFERAAALLAVPLPGADQCGALIRADAYGYACLGEPGRAARLAYRDAMLTHRRTGVYGAMWVAATIAAAPVIGDALAAAEIAVRYVPRRSRFHAAVAGAIEIARAADDWESANAAIVARYPRHGHCQVLQEVGTLVVSFRFARDVGHGICLQVMQGNDTDSFGATAGSILGVTMGPGHLPARWTEPFRDTIHLGLALFRPHRLSELAARMARLPAVLRGLDRPP